MHTTTPDTKDKLVKIIKTLLHTDEDLNFLLRLKKEELEELASVVRARTYLLSSFSFLFVSLLMVLNLKNNRFTQYNKRVEQHY